MNLRHFAEKAIEQALKTNACLTFIESLSRDINERYELTATVLDCAMIRDANCKQLIVNRYIDAHKAELEAEMKAHTCSCCGRIVDSLFENPAGGEKVCVGCEYEITEQHGADVEMRELEHV